MARKRMTSSTDRAAESALKKAVSQGKVASRYDATRGKPAKRTGKSKIAGALRRSDRIEASRRRQAGRGYSGTTGKPSTGSR